MTVVAVSGAGGFLGRHLSQELCARGHRLIALSRPQLLSPQLGEILAGVQSVVHLAARAHVLAEASDDPQAEFRRSNVVLTQTLALVAQRAGVQRFIFLSSAGVLGATSLPEGIAEDATPHPHDAYTASKLEAEEWLTAQLDARMGLVILRPPLIYGPGAKGNFMRLLRLAMKGWPLPVGALCAPRSLVAVRNIVDLIGMLVADTSPVRTTMLVADRETTSVADLYQLVAGEAGHHPWLAPVPPALIRLMLGLVGRSTDVARLTLPFVLRPQIARAQFNWVPRYSQQAELRRTVRCELDAAARADGAT
jgi:UDP-N-acetyl-alpha-D-quinovosamine dehydrogenase